MKRRPLTDCPERLLPEQRARIRAWVQTHHPELEPHLARHWHDMRDWHLSNGVQRADFEATFRRWLRKSIEIEQERKERTGRRSIEGRRTQEPEALGKLFELFPVGRRIP